MTRCAAHRLQSGTPVPRAIPCITSVAVLVAFAPLSAGAQQGAPPAGPLTVCNLPIPAPAQEPPAGSPPVVFQIVPCFDRQGNVSMIEPETYLHYIQTTVSRPSRGEWIAYNEAVPNRFSRISSASGPPAFSTT